jgi:hypothetical protein
VTLSAVLFRLLYMSIVQVTDMKVNPLVYTDVLNVPCHIFCLLPREVRTSVVVSALWNSFMFIFLVIFLD